MLSADYVFGLAVVIIVLLNFYFIPRIERERIAMQWGTDGKPTWYAPKWLAIWGMVVFMFAVRLFIWLAATYTPQSVHGTGVGVVILSFVAVGSHLFVLTKARAEN